MAVLASWKVCTPTRALELEADLQALTDQGYVIFSIQSNIPGNPGWVVIAHLTGVQ